MRELQISADRLVESLLKISEREQVCFLDSCGVGYGESHLLIAGIKPLEVLNLISENTAETLEIFNEKVSNPEFAAIFTISYDFGLKLEKIAPRKKEYSNFSEPDIFLALFDCLIIHDYDLKKSFLTGNEKRFDEIEEILTKQTADFADSFSGKSEVSSNFTRRTYIETVEKIQEFIRQGDTYQTNLTQQIRARLPGNLSPQIIFSRLRRSHPAPFSAFLGRNDDSVVSISPERFFKVRSSKFKVQSSKTIQASPIKGTRRRGQNYLEDLDLKNELLASEKDRAENVMIVDLLRNDIGRICRFGSVEVENLCELEIHPTLFHLVSTIRGRLRENVNFAEIIRAVFPCGSITGAPKIRTMRLIDELETADRGLSMGAIGYSVQGSKFGIQNSFDLSVAIRTLVIRNGEAVFNVGGGIVIDSEPENEFEESLLKAKALLSAIGGEF